MNLNTVLDLCNPIHILLARIFTCLYDNSSMRDLIIDRIFINTMDFSTNKSKS